MAGEHQGGEDRSWGSKTLDRANFYGALCPQVPDTILVLSMCMNAFNAHIEPQREGYFSRCFLDLILTSLTIPTKART